MLLLNAILSPGKNMNDSAIMLKSLPPWVRVLILATACTLIVFSVGVLVWLISPACMGRLVWCRRRKRHSDNAAPRANAPKYSIDEELELGNVTYRSWARGSLYDTTALDGPEAGSNASQRDSTYSSMSDASSIASMSSGVLAPTNGLGLPLPPAAMEGPPRVWLRLHFQEGQGQGRLAVSVVEARGLPLRDYGCSPDPCVQVEVLPRRSAWSFWSASALRSRQRPLHSLRTRTLRHARQPHFNEDFAIAARRSDVKDWMLRVCVLDECRLRGLTSLCTGELLLRAHAARLLGERQPDSDPDPLLLSVPLQLQTEEAASRGLLLFGLSYLPTSERLSITVIKACRLQVQHILPGAQYLRPYVRATLVQASSGRRMESVRTEPQDAVQGSKPGSPEFCETLCLKLAPDQLSSLSLVVAVCHRLQDSGGAQAPRARDRVIGAVALGSRVQSDRGREHWRAVEQRPRRVISVWHTLT